VASSICLRATIFQNSEGTLWTHCISSSYSCTAAIVENAERRPSRFRINASTPEEARGSQAQD
jgi:hypothetical protein